jgi:hypothetical protein
MIYYVICTKDNSGNYLNWGITPQKFASFQEACDFYFTIYNHQPTYNAQNLTIDGLQLVPFVEK